MRWLVFVALLSLAGCATTAVSWIPFSRGLPTRTTVLALAVDPHDARRIFAGAYDTTGAYVSTDQARTWEPFAVGLNGVPVLALRFVGDTLFAGTVAGLYRLHDTSWERVEPVPAVSVNAIADSGDGTVYASTTGRGIFASGDAGKTWTLLAGLDGEVILSMAALDGQILITGTSGHGAFMTRDRGETWQALDPFAGEYAALATIDPRDGKTVYLGTRHGLYRSRDTGGTWQRMTGGIESEIVHALLFTRGRIYAATDIHGVFTSDDGSSWNKSSTGLSGSGALLALAQLDAETILVGAESGAYLTRDAGKSWQVANSGSGVPHIHALALNTASGALWVATEDSLYRSDGNGDFGPVGDELQRIPVLSVALAPNNSQIVYAGTAQHGILISKDGGETWNAAGDIFRARLSIPGLLVDPTDARTIFARVLYERIYKSSNGGETWHAVWTGMRDGDQVATMRAAPSDPSQMYAGTSEGLYLSVNAGESWQKAGLEGMTTFAIWIDPHDPHTLIAGTTDGLYRRNGTDTAWTRSGLDGITVTDIERAGNGDWWAGTKYNGVWVSHDNARSWMRFGAGLDSTSIIALALDDARAVAYAATPLGLVKINYP